MKRISIWIVAFLVTFTCIGMTEASAQAGEENLEPTELSSKALRDSYVQVLESASTNQTGYTIHVIPNAMEFQDITLTVSIVDESGYSVGGLTADDFRVFEQSTTESAAVIQSLTCFHETSSGESGITFAIAMDVSGSMRNTRLEKGKDAAEAFLTNSSDPDRGSLISFSSGGMEKIELPVNAATTDSDGDGTPDMVKAIDELTASHNTALFDGTALAIDSLANEPGPKAVLVFSDGKTNDDQMYDINSLIEKANNNGVMIYCIGLGERSETLENISDLTGGKCCYASACSMSEIYDTISAGIRSESVYSMCYTTHNPAMDGTTRTVTVQNESGSGTGFYTVNFAPVITRDTATQQLSEHPQTPGEMLTISGTVTDTDAAADSEQALNAELFYRQTGHTTYSKLSLALNEGENGVYSFSQEIAAENVLKPGIEYYLYATDQIRGTFAPVAYETVPYVIQLNANKQPTANAGNDMTTEEGAHITLDGTGSMDPDTGDTLTYEWTQTGGISVELANASGQQPEFIAPRVGPGGAALTFMLTVRDAEVAQSTDTVTISVSDSVPTAAFSWSPEPQTAGDAVTFVDMSTTSGDEIVSRLWAFGEDGTDTGETPSFTFEEAGTYSVTLTVTDSDGSADTITHSITIERCPDCDPGGGCFISESIPKGGNGDSVFILFAALSLLGIGSVKAYESRKAAARGRGNRIRFTLFTGMVLTITLLAVSPEAQAEVQQGMVTVTPMVGGYMFDADQDIEEGPVYGLGLGYNVCDNWGARLSGYYGKFTHPYWDDAGRACVNEDADALVFQAELVYHLWPDCRLAPYLAAGAGYVNVDFENTGSDSSSTLNYGGGLRYSLTEDIALEASVRHIYWLEDSMSNMIGTVGLEFQFGCPE